MGNRERENGTALIHEPHMTRHHNFVVQIHTCECSRMMFTTRHLTDDGAEDGFDDHGEENVLITVDTELSVLATTSGVQSAVCYTRAWGRNEIIRGKTRLGAHQEKLGHTPSA
jgi:hypothetical protein